MSFRGRGRGGGRFGRGGGRHPGKQDTWDPFPEIENLGTTNDVVERLHLAKYYTKLQSYWKASPYCYEGDNDASKKAQSVDIERYSEMMSDKSKPKPPLSHFIKMLPEYVPAELAKGERRRSSKQVQWNPEKDMKRLDMFEKLDDKSKGQDSDEKKEDDEKDEENAEQDEGTDSDNGDYEQGDDFDDDDDGYNMDDDGDDEPTYL